MSAVPMQHPKAAQGLRPAAPPPTSGVNPVNPQRGLGPAEQITLNNQTALAARIRQSINGVPLADARAALAIVAQALNDDEAASLVPMQLPPFLMKKREHWTPAEINRGAGQVITIGGNQGIYEQAIKTGKFEPLQELPRPHIVACAQQARTDYENQAAIKRGEEERKKQLEQQEKATAEQALIELRQQEAALGIPPPFDIASADHSGLLAHLEKIWPEQEYGMKIEEAEIPEDTDKLRKYVAAVIEDTKPDKP